MRLRRVSAGENTLIQIDGGAGWTDLPALFDRLPASPGQAEREAWSQDIVALLGAPFDIRQEIAEAARAQPESGDRSDDRVLLPFAPRSYRDFMIYEGHAIAAARGFVKCFLPRLAPVIGAYEATTGRPFPKLKPSALWYRQPIYYMGNHLAFVTDGGSVEMPSYTQCLDYELELGFVLAAELHNAKAEEAEKAIGGFLVLNDFSARDVQLAEMRSGFGPQKAKHFANAISPMVVTADEILPRWRELAGSVVINGETVAEPISADPHWSLGEMLAHASRDERLYRGEFFGTGTFTGGSGIETGRLLGPGDRIEVGIAGIGSVANEIAANGRKD